MKMENLRRLKLNVESLNLARRSKFPNWESTPERVGFVMSGENRLSGKANQEIGTAHE